MRSTHSDDFHAKTPGRFGKMTVCTWGCPKTSRELAGESRLSVDLPPGLPTPTKMNIALHFCGAMHQTSETGPMRCLECTIFCTHRASLGGNTWKYFRFDLFSARVGEVVKSASFHAIQTSIVSNCL